MFRKFKFQKSKQSLNQSMPALNDNNYHYASSVVSSEENSSDFNRLDDDTTSVMDGTIHLIVHLPGGKMVEIDVDAKTPMMDLLIEVTASNGVNPGGLCLKAATDRPPGYVRYKPSTPIGKLNCQELFIVNKFDVCDAPRKPPSSNNTSLPFEPTIRVSIDLPQNQKTFLRLNPDSALEQLLIEIVRQKNRLLAFDSCESQDKILEYFALKAAKRPDLVLNLRKSLKETGFVDFTLVELKHSDSQKSTGDVFYQYTKMDLEEKKRSLDCGKSSKFFGLFKKKEKKMMPKSLSSSIVTLNRVNTPGEMDQRNFNHQGQNGQKSSSIDDSYSEKSASIDRKCEISLNNGKITSSTKIKKRQAPLPPPILSSSSNGNSTSEDDEGVVLGVKKVHAPLSSFAKNGTVYQPRKLVAAKCQLSNDSSLTSCSSSSSPATTDSSSSSRTLVVDDAASSSGYQGTATPSPELLNTTTPPPLRPNENLSSSPTGNITLRLADVDVSSTAKRKSKAPPPPKPLRNDSLVKIEQAEKSVSTTVIEAIPLQKLAELSEQKSENSLATGEFTVVANSIDGFPEECVGSCAKHSKGVCATVIDVGPLQKFVELTEQNFENPLSTSEFTVVATSSDRFPQECIGSGTNDSNRARATVIDAIPLQKLLKLSNQKIDNLSSKTGEFSVLATNVSDSFPRDYVGSCDNDYSKIEDAATTTIIIASSPEIVDQSKDILDDENESSISSPIETSSPIIQKTEFSTTLKSNNGQGNRSKNEDVTFRRHEDLAAGRTSFSSNILQKCDLYPTMSVKSFEDEYFENELKKLSNKRIAERASMFSQKSVVIPKPVSKNGCSFGRPSETKSPGVDKKESEAGQLEAEYRKLQDLFQEWKILSDSNDQNNNYLTTSQMLNFQRLQTKVLEQHELVQNLYARDQRKNKAQQQANPPTPSLQKTLRSISQDLGSTPKKIITKPTVNEKTYRKAPVSKTNNVCSEKEDLMSAIRRFGGLNGLRKANGKSA